MGLFFGATLAAQDQPSPKVEEKKDLPANIKVETRPGSGPRSYLAKISGTLEGVPENSVFTITVKPIINRFRRSDEDVYDEKDKPKQPASPSGMMPVPDPRNPAQPMPPNPSGVPATDKPAPPQGPPKATMRTIEIVTEAFYKRPLHFKVAVSRGKFEYEVELGPYVYEYQVRFFIDDQIMNLGPAADQLTSFRRAGTFLVGDLKMLTQNIREDSDYLQAQTRDMKDAVDALLAGSTKDGLKKLVGVYTGVGVKEGKLTMSACEAMLKAIAMEIQIGVRPKNPKDAPFATPLELLLQEEHGHEHKDPKSDTEVENQIKKLKDTDFEFNRLHADECYKVIDQLTQMLMRETAVNGLMILRPSLEKAVALAKEFGLSDDARKKDSSYWEPLLKHIDGCVNAMMSLDNHMKSRAIFATQYIEMSTATKPDLVNMLAAAQALVQTVKDGIQSGNGFPADFAEKANEQVLVKMERLEKELRALRILTPIAPKK